MHYNPAEAIKAEQWLSMDEQERVDAIQRWVSKQNDTDEEGCFMAAVPVLMVENQLALGDCPVTTGTFERLLEAGVDRKKPPSWL